MGALARGEEPRFAGTAVVRNPPCEDSAQGEVPYVDIAESAQPESSNVKCIDSAQAEFSIIKLVVSARAELSRVM